MACYYTQVANVDTDIINEMELSGLEMNHWIALTGGDFSQPEGYDTSDVLTNEELLQYVANGELEGYHLEAAKAFADEVALLLPYCEEQPAWWHESVELLVLPEEEFEVVGA